ncbi:STAS domain-containing protein [Sporosarcina jiandibaonis]|uniref:STAS domain-containing protein n=1 Tax=Sporosarcina jiandibaonis TaxID=2715535 RepID=UPI0015565BB2|nr:STAS domain-containing protein [Sporosarcina jiandibaonis]
MNLSVELSKEDSVQRFHIAGEIDAFTAPVLKDKLAEVQDVPGLQAELNLTDVTYIDSTGLGVFVGFYKTLKANDGYMKIIGVNDRVKRLFEITGLDEIIDIEKGVGENRDATL